MENNRPEQQDFPLAYNAYAAFDAQSLKQLMQQRLSDNGTFTDQVFEGSNFNNLLDVVAYSYNVLLYYLNQTSNESLFSNATLYENMNKIVKLVNYNPIGVQSAVLSFQATANQLLEPGVYTIPKFSYFTINDVYYSFNDDITFVKATTGVEILSEIGNRNLLHQGQFVEYPIFISTGENFEEISLVSVDQDNANDPIDHNNIFVFVRDGSGKWREWKRVDSLYLEPGSSECFESRLNENQRYAIKFGNNVAGKKLIAGNLVSIYYLKSDKEVGAVGPNTLDNNQLFFYSTEQFNTIMADIRSATANVISNTQVNNISFTNSNASTNYSDVESSNQIKINAPNLFKQRNRLVTVEDFKNYILYSFGNIVSDVVVVNNWEYIDKHIRYLYNLGIKSPSLDSRVMINQISFSDSCNFNNVYIYCLPKMLQTNDFSFERGFLSLGLKDYIITKLETRKLATVELIVQDPVFYAVGFGVGTQDEIFSKALNSDITSKTKLVVQRSNSSNLSISEIRGKVAQTILDYFSFSKVKLGQVIDLQTLTQNIYNVGGISSISTVRDSITVPGISLLGFNPVYNASSEDIQLITQNLSLPYFKVPYWYDTSSLLSQIEVVYPGQAETVVN